MTDTGASPRELLWLACREKACCTAKVIVTGADVRRIAGTLDADPWNFTVVSVAEPGAPDAFQLARGGRRYQMALAKRPEWEDACVFLWKLNDGHAQCGLGALRPGACRAYPAFVVDGMLCADSSACTCRRWSVLDLDGEADRVLIGELAAEQAAYASIVAQWNAALPEAPAQRTYEEFCRFVMDAYAPADR